MSAPQKKMKKSSRSSKVIDDLPYCVEYSKSGRSKCNICLELIPKDSLRMAIVVQSPYHDGKWTKWHHASCFFENHLPKTTGDIAQFDTIRWEHQEEMRKTIEKEGAFNEENIPPQAKKIKLESDDDKGEKNLKNQQIELFNIRDKLSNLKKKELTEMLEANSQEVPVGQNEILDTLADALLFGALEPCSTCNGQLKFKSGIGYKCTGNVTRWVCCENVTQDPKRKEFLIPEYLKEKYTFLENLEPKVQRRLLKITAPSTSRAVQREDATDGAGFQVQRPAWSLVFRGNRFYEESTPGKIKLRVKCGSAVDPDSCLEDVAHVYQRNKEKFTATLGITNIQTKKNSFYRLQILKHDKEEKYWLFRSWGRIGTGFGDTKLESLSLEECIRQFEELYEEKSGNRWSNRMFFVKVTDKMYPIDVDDGEDSRKAFLNSGIESKLKEPVQDLMRLIFDENSMKEAMLEYEIDTNKLPLGKITKDQIDRAYGVLTQLSILIKKGGQDRYKMIEESNKFYTLIPHNFGVKGAKIIETEKEIQKKSEMLQALLEMEIAYNLLYSNPDETKNPLDTHYDQLKTDIDVLDHESDEFKLIEKYVKNTHAAIHDKYELAVEEVFIAKRSEEESRFEPFKNFPNRKLLWHGSRATNYTGILSQGLRIAPPEAPKTGYMFGKGIYFADMVSKSANYCKANPQNSTGLLLLCEVALGTMYELYDAEYIETLPDGYHSIWARGETQPDPEKSVELANGVEVPCGPAIPSDIQQKPILNHNEYIVYDPAQVKVEYLVKVNFKYNLLPSPTHRVSYSKPKRDSDKNEEGKEAAALEEGDAPEKAAAVEEGDALEGAAAVEEGDLENEMQAESVDSVSEQPVAKSSDTGIKKDCSPATATTATNILLPATTIFGGVSAPNKSMFGGTQFLQPTPATTITSATNVTATTADDASGMQPPEKTAGSSFGAPPDATHTL